LPTLRGEKAIRTGGWKVRLSGHNPCPEAFRILQDGVPDGKYIFWATPTVRYNGTTCDLVCTNCTSSGCIGHINNTKNPGRDSDGWNYPTTVTLRDCDPSELDKICSTAEFSIALLLSLMRNIPQAMGNPESERQKFVGNTLAGKTVLIVGYGRVGKQIAARLKPWGCEITTSESDGETRLKLRHADIVFLCATASPENHGMFGADYFALMERAKWFVNTARGELVDWFAAYNWCNGAAGLIASDFAPHQLVWDDGSWDDGSRTDAQEDMTEWGCIFTPHLGGCTFEDQRATEILIARKVVEVLNA